MFRQKQIFGKKFNQKKIRQKKVFGQTKFLVKIFFSQNI